MRFFITLREKKFVLGELRKGNFLAFTKYLLYRFNLSSLFLAERDGYVVPVYKAPFAFWLWNHPRTKKREEEFLKAYLRPGDTVIDAGAHIGTLSVLASRLVGSGGAIYSIEPHPKTFQFLSRTIARNRCKNITTYQCAVTSKLGTAHMTDFQAKDINHLHEEGDIRVSTATLDSLFPKETHITLLKLDVEGSELFALQGAEKLLTHTQAVYFESAPRQYERFGYTLEDVTSFLMGRNFRLYSTHISLPPAPLPDHHVTTVTHEDLLAVKTGSPFEKRLTSK